MISSFRLKLNSFTSKMETMFSLNVETIVLSGGRNLKTIICVTFAVETVKWSRKVSLYLSDLGIAHYALYCTVLFSSNSFLLAVEKAFEVNQAYYFFLDYRPKVVGVVEQKLLGFCFWRWYLNSNKTVAGHKCLWITEWRYYADDCVPTGKKLIFVWRISVWALASDTYIIFFQCLCSN